MKFAELITESINDKGLFKVVFVAYSPYAGKSYTLDRIKGGEYPIRVINTDSALEFLSKKYGMDPSDAYDIVGEQSKTTTKETLYHAVNGMLPMIVDGTSSNASNLLRRKGFLESLGYDTAMLFVDVELDTVLKRMNDGGRERKVPEEFVRSTYQKVYEMREYYKNTFGSNFISISNNDGDLTDETITQAYVKFSKYFGSELGNPLAKRTLSNMEEEGYKYLDEGIFEESYLNRGIDDWYKN
jgi:hypothetical protein